MHYFMHVKMKIIFVTLQNQELELNSTCKVNVFETILGQPFHLSLHKYMMYFVPKVTILYLTCLW